MSEDLYLRKTLSFDDYDEFAKLIPAKFFEIDLINQQLGEVTVGMLVREYWKHVTLTGLTDFQLNIDNTWKDIFTFDILVMPDKEPDWKYLIQMYSYDSVTGAKSSYSMQYRFSENFRRFRVVSKELIIEFENWSMVIR